MYLRNFGSNFTVLNQCERDEVMNHINQCVLQNTFMKCVSLVVDDVNNIIGAIIKRNDGVYIRAQVKGTFPVISLFYNGSLIGAQVPMSICKKEELKKEEPVEKKKKSKDEE